MCPLAHLSSNQVCCRASEQSAIVSAVRGDSDHGTIVCTSVHFSSGDSIADGGKLPPWRYGKDSAIWPRSLHGWVGRILNGQSSTPGFAAASVVPMVSSTPNRILPPSKGASVPTGKPCRLYSGAASYFSFEELFAGHRHRHTPQAVHGNHFRDLWIDVYTGKNLFCFSVLAS